MSYDNREPPSSHLFYEGYFDELARRLRDASADQLDALCNSLVQARERGRKVVLAGNGASAAIASHVAVDLTKASGIRAVNFNEVDLITCFGNDYGYENWIAKATEFYGDAGDVVVLISSSGESQNVVNAAARARELGLSVVTLSGFAAENRLRTLGDLNLWVNSSSYNIVETTHQSWLLAAIDRIAQSRESS
ncbi:MAG TPA: SIS domain-containing protein [Acidobacteriota bacterium]|nr:SIS domain-containing protein [Acidobacteriota bacterium]